MKIKPGQGWRLKNKLCKYIWLESALRDKVYLQKGCDERRGRSLQPFYCKEKRSFSSQQKGTVKYADYKVGMYYISPKLVYIKP